MSKFCGGCGTPVTGAERFCGKCGRPLGQTAPPPPPPQYSAPPPPPPPQFAPAPPPQAPYQAPYAPPQPQPQYYGGGVRPWPFQVSVAAQGDSLAKSMGIAKPGQAPGLIEMMFRAAFLDWNVYRQAAADTAGGNNAWMALAIPFLISTLGIFVTTLSLPGLTGLLTCVATVAVQAGAFALAVWVMSAAAPSVIQKKVEFGTLFRPLAYAQSTAVLGLIPVVGALVQLWRLVTSLAATREAAQCDEGKAIILLVIGGIVVAIGFAILTPVMFVMVRMFG